MEGTATVVDYSTISDHDLVEKFATMNQALAANPPPGFDTGEWTRLSRELVTRIPGIDADTVDRVGPG